MKTISSDSYIPKYEQLKRILRQKIKSKEYKLGQAIPSMQQMPDIFKVSKHTVIRAVTDLVQEGLLYKEQGRGTFVKEIATRKSKKKNAKIISFIVHNIRDYFISEICRGVESAAREKGYHVIISNSDCSIEKETENIRRLEETNASGAIIYPFGRENAEEIFKLKQDNYPFVLVDMFFKDIKTNHVVVDNSKGGFLAVKHLTDLGHTRIGFIGFLESSTGFGRFEGYKEAISRTGIAYDDNLVIDIPHNIALETIGREEEKVGRQGEIDRLLNLKDRPTAVFCGNDFTAIGVIKRLQELGLRVPEDIAVVGFDDLPISSMISVPLTTVSQPKYEIGKVACEILINKIEGNASSELKEIVLDTKLIVRDSSFKQ